MSHHPSVEISIRRRIAGTLALTAVVLQFGVLAPSARAVTILQAPGSTVAAFEAENPSAIVNGTPEFWGRVTDETASGGAALEALGENEVATAPHSFAQYRIQFSTPGTYYIYYRWRADPVRTEGDIFTANSSWFPLSWDAPLTPGNPEAYYTSSSNAETAPADNVYAWRREADTAVYEVTAADVASDRVLIFTMGTREAGMMLDRFIFSTSPDLTAAALDALDNSPTDVVTQGTGDSYIAFQAEGRARLIPGTPETWANVSDPEASAGGALEAVGENNVGTSPHSFAQYQLRFTTAGTYYLYYRWRANPARTEGDIFTANSSWFPLSWDAPIIPGNQDGYYTSSSNAETAPADNVYAWRREPDSALYEVTAGDLTAPDPLVFTIGTREAGMMIDRWVLSTVPDLTPAALDALPDSGSLPLPPEVAAATGSAALNTVVIQFTRPLDPATVRADAFNATPPLAVTEAQLDADDARLVRLSTAMQAAGTAYTLAITGVKDTSGTEVAPGTTARFTAWQRVNGWTLTEIWFGIPGNTVDALLEDPRYQAGVPDRAYWVQGFQLNQDPRADNYGARLSAYLQPPASGAYDLFINNDDEAQLQLSSSLSPDNLAFLGDFPLSPPVFDPFIYATTPSLTAGQGYLLYGLLKQGGGDVYLNVAGRASGANTPPVESLQPLGGDWISTWINPDLGQVTLVEPPANQNVPAGRRATFSVKLEARSNPVYYQWQRDGVDLPDAVRSTYVTPVLTGADSGARYRVLIRVAGVETASPEAILTVSGSEPPTRQPYVGINFVGGGGGSVGGTLRPLDVAGVVPQEHWNNLEGFQFDGVALQDASGAPSPVLLTSFENTETWYSGTRVVGNADGILFQGFVDAGASQEPITYTLSNVPPGSYQVLVYSIGFDFSPSYLQVYSLEAGGSYPTYYGRSETGLNYVQSPEFRRMAGTDPGNRPTGNYVQFDAVQPAADGSITLSVTWDSTEAGNGHQPAVSGLQLVRDLPPPQNPVITGIAVEGDNLRLTWTGGTAPFQVQRRSSLTSGGWDSAGTPTTTRTALVPLGADPVAYLQVVGQ